MLPTDRDIANATAIVRWLLEQGLDGIPLTKTNALGQAVVREAARRWPQWWHAELFGEPHREAELAVLETLHATLLHLKLVRRRSGRLVTTPRGRDLLTHPEKLFDVLLEDLQGQDAFQHMIWSTVLDQLGRAESVPYLALADEPFARACREGWRDREGAKPTKDEVGWMVPTSSGGQRGPASSSSTSTLGRRSGIPCSSS